MEAAEEKREIEVRSLTGESVRVRISASRTVGDLKQFISGLAFPSASNFHLFFKGAKLSPQIHVGAVGIGEGDFLVLIPFAKKQKLKEPGSDPLLKVPKPSPISKFADLAYADMMEELSSLQNDDRDAIGVPDQMNVSHSQNKSKMESDGKNARVEDGLYECLWNVLQAPCEDITVGQNCEKLVGILESMNSCLRTPRSGGCAVIVGLYGGVVRFSRNESARCFCPVWLKRIVQVFSFMNIYAAVIQVQKTHIVSENLRDVMNRLGKHGFKGGFEDVVHLSMLCNEVVCFSDNTTDLQHSTGTIVVFNSGRADRDPAIHPKTGGTVIMSKIYNAMKKRESHFKMSLSEALKSFAKRGMLNVKVISLEDLTEFVKEGGVCAHADNRKRKKGSPVTTSCTSSFKPCCRETTQLLPVEMVEHLREGFGSKGQMVHIEIIGARMPSFVEVPENLSANTRNALEHLGISKLYSHQAESILASLAGKSVVVATMTSSGKSLCYNVPVLEVLSQNESSCALYLFPTKALAQDQLRGLLKMTDSLSTTLHMGIYDGDTSEMDRWQLRAKARLLITNPDMLHVSILPHHKKFSRILSNLRFVVIDEAHAYKGAFGCHTALIIRRLRRLCAHKYSSDPSFIFSTATSANPREHCMELANLSTLELIQNDGSPSSQKLFALWNPSSRLTAVDSFMVMDMDANASVNENMSPILEVSHLLAEMVQHGLRCIAFCRSRKLTEIVLSYTREILKDVASDLAESICAYRAGYVAEDRRKIEGEFFSGKLCGIVATNALELGIDVGHVDATLHLGFPGSIASLWQQAGRSGRRERPSLAVYVAFEGPLDQYFMKFPKKLFGGQIECCHIDAENQQVVKQHLICAAFEHPLSLLYDEKYFGPSVNEAVTSLKNKGELSFDPAVSSSARLWSYIGHKKVPSRCVSIRAIDTVRYKLIDMLSNELLEEIEESKAFFQVHKGAIYLHQGKTYLVQELDLSEKVAFCREADVKYYTKTRDYTDIQVLGGDMAYSASSFKNLSLRTTAQARSCNVTTTWFGFYCIQRGTAKILDVFELELPQYRYESQAAWIRVPEPIKKLVEEKNLSFHGGLHAASHALLSVVPLYVRCNLSDLAPECPNPHDRRYYPARILVYDQHPGGTGVSMQIQPYFSQLLEAALDLLTSCHCLGLTGCPNCIQSMVCHKYNEDVNKDAAIMILKGVLDSERAFFSGTHDNGDARSRLTLS